MNTRILFESMNCLSYFLSPERARFAGVYNSFHGLHNNSKGEIPRCLSVHVTDSSASLIGTSSCLSERQDEQRPAYQMVICSTSHLCRVPDSLQPRTVSSIHAARQLLPTTLPNGSSQSHGPPRQTGSSICSRFWQRDASLSGSTS